MDSTASLNKELKTAHAAAYFNIITTSSKIETKTKEALKAFKLTHAQLNVLSILMQNHPRPVSARELKEKILVSNPDVTRLLDRLVKIGLVQRETCPENRRKIDIGITDTGQALYIKAHNAAKVAVNNYFEDQITVEEAQELRRILHKIQK